MKLTKLHNQIRYTFLKLNYSIEKQGTIWSIFCDMYEGISPEDFLAAFDELVQAGFIGKQTLYWCQIKPKRHGGQR